MALISSFKIQTSWILFYFFSPFLWKSVLPEVYCDSPNGTIHDCLLLVHSLSMVCYHLQFYRFLPNCFLPFQHLPGVGWWCETREVSPLLYPSFSFSVLRFHQNRHVCHIFCSYSLRFAILMGGKLCTIGQNKKPRAPGSRSSVLYILPQLMGLEPYCCQCFSSSRP